MTEHKMHIRSPRYHTLCKGCNCRIRVGRWFVICPTNPDDTFHKGCYLLGLKAK